MCIQSCREAGTSTGSGNTRITQRASNPTECQAFRATRKAILTAILMTARGRNSTTNGRPSQPVGRNKRSALRRPASNPLRRSCCPHVAVGGQSQEPASAWDEGVAIIGHGADDRYGGADEVIE